MMKTKDEEAKSTAAGTRMQIDLHALISRNDIDLNALPGHPGTGMKLGNGDIGVSVYQSMNKVFLNVGKNDILDYRNAYDAIKPRTQKEFLEMYADKSKPHVQEYLMNGVRGHGEKGGIEDISNMLICNLYETVPMPTAKPACFISIEAEGHDSGCFRPQLSLYEAELNLNSDGGLHFHMLTPHDDHLIIAECKTRSPIRMTAELIRERDKSGYMDARPCHSSSGNDLFFEYTFPGDRLNYPSGFRFAVCMRLAGGRTLDCHTRTENEKSSICFELQDECAIVASVFTSRDSNDPLQAACDAVDDYCKRKNAVKSSHKEYWKAYWGQSYLHIPSRPFLEKQWYISQYLLASCWKEGCEPPGLYGPWIWEDKTLYGNDLHWDYNIQQSIWAAFSSNRLGNTMPYYMTALQQLDAAKTEARETYGLNGAKYPLTSWPGKFDHSSYPAIHYDRMMSINCWVAHPFWWYYQYSQDKDFLEKVAYPVMKECAVFYEEYLTLNAEGQYEIWPTAIWDLHLSKYLRQNRNCIMDLAFMKYLFNACADAAGVLGTDTDKSLIWRHIARNLHEYPSVFIEKGKFSPVDMTVGGVVPVQDAQITPKGKVFTAFEGMPVITNNVPVACTVVFPCDAIGIGSPHEDFAAAVNTVFSTPYYAVDDLVMLTMARVRLGSDEFDLYEKLTRKVCLESGGMGIICDNKRIWLNCTGWPLVINESILQSHQGIIRVNPTGLKSEVAFVNLRARGAFLVSGEIDEDGTIKYITVKSEAGCRFMLHQPWTGMIRVREHPNLNETCFILNNDIIELDTISGCMYVIDCPDRQWEDYRVNVIT